MKGIGIRSGNMSKHNTSHHPQHFFFFLAFNIAYGCEYMRYNRNSCAVSYLLRYRATNVDLGMSTKMGQEKGVGLCDERVMTHECLIFSLS